MGFEVRALQGGCGVISCRLRGLGVGFGEVRTISVLKACGRFTGFGKKT